MTLINGLNPFQVSEYSRKIYIKLHFDCFFFFYSDEYIFLLYYFIVTFSYLGH